MGYTVLTYELTFGILKFPLLRIPPASSVYWAVSRSEREKEIEALDTWWLSLPEGICGYFTLYTAHPIGYHHEAANCHS